MFSRIGSPAVNGARANETATRGVASGRSWRRIKLLLAVAVGQVCHWRSSGATDWPRPMSDLATRTSAVRNCTTGSAWRDLLSDPLARYAATTPALRAMVRTTIRAVYIRFTIYTYAGTPELYVGLAASKHH